MKKELMSCVLLMILAVPFSAGCTLEHGLTFDNSTDKLTTLKLGMRKDETISVMGMPDSIRGAIKNKYDQVIEIWEYVLYARGGLGRGDTYLLYLYDDHLVQWGRIGDWAPDKVYEIRFKPTAVP